MFPPSSRRGNAAFSALTLGAVVGFGALAVDIGLVRVARTQLQTSLDAAALSGAQELDGTGAGIAAAQASAFQYAAVNTVLRQPVQLSANDVEIGVWDAAADTFAPWSAGEDPGPVNAVRITHAVPPVYPSLAAVAFGAGKMAVEATSVALRETGAGPAGDTQCFLPFAIPSCHLAALPEDSNPQPFKFTFAPTPTDKIAWGDPSNNPTSSDVRDQLLGQCDEGRIQIGDTMYVNEGGHTSALHALGDILNNRTTAPVEAWDPEVFGSMPARDGVDANLPKNSGVSNKNWGTTLQGPVALIDGGADCNAVAFPGEYPITGFAWAVVYDVQDTSTGKNVFMLLDVVAEHEIWGEVDEGGSPDQNVTGTSDASLGGW